MRKKIVHLVEDLEIGGQEKVIFNIVKNLNKEKYDVGVWCIEKGGTIAEWLIKEGIEVKILGIKTYHSLKNILKLSKLLKKEKVKILHCHSYFANTFGRLCKIFGNVPFVIVHYHSTYSYFKRKNLIMDRILSLFTVKILCCSYAVKKWIIENEKINPEKIIVLYNGIEIGGIEEKDVKKILKIKENDRVVGFIGRLEPIKNPEILLNLIKIIRNEIPEVKLLIVGDGSLREKMERLIKPLGIERNVIFAGRVENVFPYIKIMDLVILPSKIEGLGISLIEAMALEKPVVGTNVGGIPEVIEDGINGFVVEPDDLENLKKAVYFLLKNKEEAKKMGKEGQRIWEEKFSVESMVKKIEGIYDGLY